jgi:IclR family pca regulon transcriptional regulator
VAQLTGLTRAAARRYLITLTHLGYMRHDNKTFSLTPMVLRLGQSYLHSARLPRIVQPLLYRLAYSLGRPPAGCSITTSWCAWRR